MNAFPSSPSRLLALLPLLLAGCMVGPDYVRPSAPAAAAYRELGGWKRAEPSDHAPRGRWWDVFGDPQLGALLEQVELSNQNLALAEAQFRQAQALVQAARSAYYPTLSVGGSVERVKPSGTLGSRPAARGAYTDYVLQANVGWELDLWGRLRRLLEANVAVAQASAGDLQSARLSAQAELAQDYFQLRALDAQQQLLQDATRAYEKSLQLTRTRYAAGVAARSDVALAQTLHDTTRAQAIDIGVRRAQLEHAIAVLIGKPPSEFALERAALTALPPPVPAGLPAELLERRPDIAAAERRVAAANAQIGAAIAAYYPTVTLGASGGFESTSFSKWLTAPSRFWALGPLAVSEAVFDAGLRRAVTAQARAAYDQDVAAYRQSVLNGFREVEDNLAALRTLEEEAQAQEAAVKSAEQSVQLITNQYKAGTVSYLDVVVAQTALLNNQRTAVEIQGRRVVASVLLVRALGGGWSAAQLPSEAQLGRAPGTPRSTGKDGG
jgi:NodT family efflux transporter outer membrane factor (OMF) lipoprotein